MSSNTTILSLLKRMGFDSPTGKVYRMFSGVNDPSPREYELPLTDIYLNSPFDLFGDWPDFFAEDLEHFYFVVLGLPGEQMLGCKTKRSSRQLVPINNIYVELSEELIHLAFSKTLFVEIGKVAESESIAAYWREARVAAAGKSLEAAVLKLGIQIVNRLVSSSGVNEYQVKPDPLITNLLREQGITAAVNFKEIDSEDNSALLDDSATNHTLEGFIYTKEQDPNFN